jgi:hypothetical protein
MTAWQFAGFLLCVGVASCAQGITGFAQSLILLGLTSLFHLAPLPEMANVAMVMSLASAMVAIRAAPPGSLDKSVMRSTVSGSLFGVAAGVALLAWLDANVVFVLRLLLGLVVIACAVVVLLRREPLAQRSSTASFRAYGFASGVLGGLFSSSGPPLVYQFYRQPMSVDSVRDTLMATLAVGSLLRLVMVVGSGHFALRSLVMCAAAVPLAMGITWWIRRRPPPWSRRRVLLLVCALLMVTGVGLVGPALHKLFA